MLLYLKIVSSKVFQVVFFHLAYNSALFLESYCLFLLHVIANLICILLVSRHLLLLSNFFFPCVVTKGLHCCSSEKKKIITIDVKRLLSFFVRAQMSLPYERMGRASALYTLILEKFWTKNWFKNVV